MSNSTENLKANETIKPRSPDAKFIFQFINCETGHRSEAFTGNWDDVKDVLDQRDEDHPRPLDTDYILLHTVLDEEKTYIPLTPLVTVKSYLQFINDKDALAKEA